MRRRYRRNGLVDHSIFLFFYRAARRGFILPVGYICFVTSPWYLKVRNKTAMSNELQGLRGYQSTAMPECIASAGTGSVPAGFKTISIVKTSNNTLPVTITMGDASTYVMTELGEVFSQSTGTSHTLPAYAVSGTGTVKWHGIK